MARHKIAHVPPATALHLSPLVYIECTPVLSVYVHFWQQTRTIARTFAMKKKSFLKKTKTRASLFTAAKWVSMRLAGGC
jgi:hypothetical protein